MGIETTIMVVGTIVVGTIIVGFGTSRRGGRGGSIRTSPKPKS